MSLTLRVDPSSFLHPAFNAVQYGVETSRTAAITKNVSTLTNNSGKLHIATSAAHGMETGDVVTLAGFTNLPQDRTKVKVTSSIGLRCEDIDYSASITQSGGTVTRSNDNFKVRCYVKVGTPVVGQKYINFTTSSGGYDVYLFDVSGILQDYILNQNEGIETTDNGSTGAVSPSAAYTGTNYILEFAEIYDDYAGVPFQSSTLTVTTVDGTAMRAVNMGMQTGQTFADYVCTLADTGKFLTNIKTIFLRSTEVYTVQLLTTEASAGIKYTRYLTDGMSAATNGSLVTVANNRMLLTVLGSTLSGTKYMEVEAISTANALITNEKITIYPLTSVARKTARLRWKNLLGGVDQLYFNDLTEDVTADGYEYESTTGIKTYDVQDELTATLEATVTREQAEGLRDLFVSKVVYLNTERVNLIDRAWTYETRDNITLRVRVKKQRLVLN